MQILDSGFPLKSGESNDDFSVTFWYKAESQATYSSIGFQMGYWW